MFEEELISVVKGGKTYGPAEHRVHTQAEFDQAVSAHKHIYMQEEIVQRVEERNLLELIKQGVEHMRVHYYGRNISVERPVDKAEQSKGAERKSGWTDTSEQGEG